MSKTGECWSTLLRLLHRQTDPEPFKLSSFIPMPKQYNFMLWWNTFSNHFNLFHHTTFFFSFQSTEKRFISWRHFRDDLFVSRSSSCYSSSWLKFRHSFHTLNTDRWIKLVWLIKLWDRWVVLWQLSQEQLYAFILCWSYGFWFVNKWANKIIILNEF